MQEYLQLSEKRIGQSVLECDLPLLVRKLVWRCKAKLDRGKKVEPKDVGVASIGLSLEVSIPANWFLIECLEY